MYSRRIRRSSRFATTLTCLIVLACRAYPGGPVLPTPSTDDINVGYGTQDRRYVSAAVGQVDGEKLMASSPRTVSDMLVGRFAGVEVYQLANGRTSIRIRGARSFNASQEPLFVIDGMPQHNGSVSLADLHPQDVKSIEVLKDASATSVYGSRGANGVILISTKRTP